MLLARVTVAPAGAAGGVFSAFKSALNQLKSLIDYCFSGPHFSNAR